MKNTSPTKPNVCDFINIRDYLSEYYTFRKVTAKGFSYETWAQELGVKSRSFLRMVIMGQRPITKIFAETLSYGLRLNEKELKYFFLLVEYSRAKSKEQKSFYWKQMLVILRSEDNRQELAAADFVSSHWLPKIQTILTFSDIEKTTENIAKLLDVDKAAALRCLEKLEEFSLAKKISGEGAQPVWHTDVQNFKVPEAFQSTALKNYYIQSFDDAKAAIALPAEVRKFRSLLLPLNPEEYGELLAKLEEAFQEILSQYKADKLKGRNLYQMGMSLVPITKV